MKKQYVTGGYFYGNKISDYGLENGYVDYATFSKAFSAVLNNEIIQHGDYWDQLSGFPEEDEDWAEIFQYYIVSDLGAEILQEYDEIVFYNEKFDMYLWGVTHWGTSWDYVLTDIKCNYDPEKEGDYIAD